jgi:hypothetical protein
MRLPPRLLDRVRVGLGVSALFVPGCDAASDLVDAARDLTEADAAAPATENAEEAHRPAATATASDDDDASPALGAQIAEALARADARPPVAAEAIPLPPDSEGSEAPTGEDVTEFVPFSERPGGPAVVAEPAPPRRPLRVRPRIDEVEPCESPKLVERPGGGWECPACGRG